MTFDMWNERWKTSQTAFHKEEPNDALVAHLDAIERVVGKAKLRVLVPLAGKSVDMQWLSDRGHEVVGVEFVRQAIDELFAGAEVRAHQLGPHEAFTARGVTMLCEDIFKLEPAALGAFDLIFDRGAIVAIPPDTREQYVQLCRALLGEKGQTLLVVVAYDQSKAEGPPWSVDPATVQALFAGREINTLDIKSTEPPKRLAEAGITDFNAGEYLIGR